MKFISEWQLSRPGGRPLLDLLLFAQKIVDFGLQCLNAGCLPIRHRLSVFDKAVDQQVLQLGDPGPLFWSEQGFVLIHCHSPPYQHF